MSLSRRTFLASTAALAAASTWPQLFAADPATPKIRVGSCGVNLDQAKQAGLDGVEIGVGGPAERLSIADPRVRENYKRKMRETGLAISSFMMGLFNECPLASDPRGPAWLEQSI
ncbi:MAG TPA: hypothetical protein VHP11_17230, partial [Tepidisphaeraceae bacterium]|nr:hypothetical protein [Tepidisphaeraceae bacterium]